MIRLDFVEIIQHKSLVIWLIQFIGQQSSYDMVYGDIAGLEQPVGTGKFAVNVLEHQNQALITFDQQVVHK